jgi:integrase/recombinase XerD
MNLVRAAESSLASDVLDVLRAIPEERLWLEGQRSAATRRAYRSDVAGFMSFLGITTPEELRKLDRGAVLAWKRHLEASGTKPSTQRRKLAALSSLFAHLVRHRVVRENPCREITRPRVNARRGTTAAFSAAQARAILDAPDPVSLQGLRDRALLSVGFQAGPRRSSIVGLRVRDFHQDSGFDCLRFVWKGGHEHAVALHPQTAQRIRDYLKAAGHDTEAEAPLFRPVAGEPRALTPEQVGRILARYVQQLRIEGRYSAHSMRATFVTTALANGASLEDVQEAAGHADPSTTKLYDRRGYNPEKSAAFFANY